MLAYLAASILLGCGIAVDVALATIAMARDPSFQKNSRFWILAVTGTHVLLPMVGYYSFAFAYRHVPEFRFSLGIIAALIVGWFLIGYFKNCVVGEFADSDSGPTSFVMVFFVSWDALCLGPAMSAQAVEWTALQVFLSFLIAGATVAIVAVISAHFAVFFYSRMTPLLLVTKRRQARRDVVALWLEFSIIAYFGVLALARYVFLSEIDWPSLLGIVMGISLLLFVVFWRRIEDGRMKMYSQMSKAAE